jgi:hypothetical protein
MNLQEQILALLKTQFPGVREDGLQQLAAMVSLQVADDKEAATIVGKFTAEKVQQFVKDWRSKTDAEISKANQTYETSLKDKYDFVEKGKQKPNPDTKPTPPADGALTLDAVKNLIAEQLQGIQASITSMSDEKVAETRKGMFVAALDKAKLEGSKREMLMDNFGRMTFKDDADFNNFLTSQSAHIATLAQEEADKNLSNHDAPIFGAVTKDGVSQGVADYIAQRAEESKNPVLTGRDI